MYLIDTLRVRLIQKWAKVEMAKFSMGKICHGKFYLFFSHEAIKQQLGEIKVNPISLFKYFIKSF